MPAKTHGESGGRGDRRNAPLYRTWSNMKSRCGSTSHPRYADYGGRGIVVCDEWSKSYEAFRDWSRSNGYRIDLELDRIDNDGPYSPDNCRWTTQAVNALNCRSNVRVTAFTETKTLAEWERDPRCKVQGKTFWARLRRYGWTPEEALTKPSRQGKVQ